MLNLVIYKLQQMLQKSIQKIINNPRYVVVFICILLSIINISLIYNSYMFNLNNSNINKSMANRNNSVIESTYKSTYSVAIIIPSNKHLSSRGDINRDNKVIVTPKPTEKPKELPKKENNYIDSFIGNITMYTLDFSDCGKYPWDIEYGITASGTYVKRFHTVAADPNIPFNTKLKIEGFSSIFTVLDRGSGVGYHAIDLYTTDKEQADRWGRKKRMVYILSYGSQKSK